MKNFLLKARAPNFLLVCLLSFGFTVAFSSAGRSAVGSEAPSEPIKVLTELKFQKEPLGVHWASNGQELAIYLNKGNDVAIFDLDKGLVHQLDLRRGTGDYLEGSAAFLDDDQFLLTPPATTVLEGSHYGLSLWNIASEKVVRQIDGPAPEKNWQENWADKFSVSDDGSVAVAVTTMGQTPDQNVTIYDTVNFTILRNLKLDLAKDVVSSVAIAHKGDQVAIGTVGGTVKIFSTSTGDLKTSFAAYPLKSLIPIGSMAFTSDGTYLVTAAGSAPSRSKNAHPIQIRQSSNGENFAAPTLPAAALPIREIAIGHGDRMAFAGQNNSVYMWRSKGTLRLIALERVMAIAFAPDGVRLAVCNAHGVTILDTGP